MNELVKYTTVILLSNSLAVMAQVGTPNAAQPQSQAGAANSPMQSTNENNGSDVTGDIATTRLGPLYMADRFPGSDFAAKAGACLSAVEAVGGGTCDARSLTGPQRASANVTVGDGKHQVALLLPATTITFAPGAQLIFRAYSSISGQGTTNSSKIVCSDGDLGSSVCVQSFDESARHQLYNADLENFEIANSVRAKQGSGSVGLQLGGAGFVDVLKSSFRNLYIHGFDIGTAIRGVGGCTCYNNFYEVSNGGSTAGVVTQNLSGYAGSVNSNHWTGGEEWGPVGLLDVGGGANTWNYLDFESNRSQTGQIVYAGPDGNNDGSGYSKGDTVQPSGGSASAVLKVKSVNKEGAVTALTVLTPGTDYKNIESVPTTTLTGRGTGLKVDLRVSGYQIIAGYADVSNYPYEEAGAGDYICGTLNVINMAFQTSGSYYAPTYCKGKTTGYGGPLSNFQWGPQATPNSIGMKSIGKISPYIAFNSEWMYDRALDSAWQSSDSYGTDLWADGPAYSGGVTNTYGRYGHSPWNTGLEKPHSGIDATGKVTISALADPAAPAVTAFGGTGTDYTYYVVAQDANGGFTLPSGGTTVSGAATLGAVLDVAPKASGTGYRVNDVVTLTGNNSPGTAKATVKAVNDKGGVTALAVIEAASQYSSVSVNNIHGKAAAVYSTTGGSGTGLTVTITSTYNLITPESVDGYSCIDTLKGDTSTVLPVIVGSTATCAGSSSLPYRYDFGQATTSYTAPTRNSTADATIAGNLIIQSVATSRSTSPVCPNGPGGALTTIGCGSATTSTAGDSPESYHDSGLPVRGIAAASNAAYFNDFFSFADVSTISFGGGSGQGIQQDASNASATNHPGILKINSATSTAGGGVSAVIPGEIGSPWSQAQWDWETVVMIPTTPATTAGSYQMGLVGNGNANSDSWSNVTASFRLSSFDSKVDDWYCTYRNSSGSVVNTDSGIAASAGAWVRLSIKNDGAHLNWYIGGTQVCGIGVALSSLDSGSSAGEYLGAWSVTNESGSTQVFMDVDYISYKMALQR